MQTSGTVNLCRDALVSDERNDEEKQKKNFSTHHSEQQVPCKHHS